MTKENPYTQVFPNDLPKEEENIKQIPHKTLSKKKNQNLCQRDDIIVKKPIKEVLPLLLTLMILSENPIKENKFHKKLTIDTNEINRIEMKRTTNELKSSYLLDEKIKNDL